MQALDFLGEAADAFLPGDLIPSATTDEDYMEGSELIGLDEDAHWLGKLAADVGVGVLTDPLTYLTMGIGGAVTKGAKAATQGTSLAGKSLSAAKRAVKAGNTLADAVENMGRKVLATTDDVLKASKAKTVIKQASKLRPSLDDVAALDKLRAAPFARLRIPFTDIGADLPVTFGQIEKVVGDVGGLAKKVIPQGVQDFGNRLAHSVRGGLGWFRHSDQFDDILAKVGAAGRAITDVERRWLADTFKGVKAGSALDNALGALMNKVLPLGDDFVDLENVADPVAEVAKTFAVSADELAGYAEKITDFGKVQWDNLVRNQVVSGEGITDYFPRIFRGAVDEGIETGADLGSFSGVAKRKLTTAKEVIDTLKANPGMTLEQSAITTLSERIGQQGRLAQKGQLVRQLLGEGAGAITAKDSLVRDGMSTIVDTLLKQDPEMGTVVDYLIKGSGPRGWAADLLALNNKIFKPAATHGLLLPRFSFHTRNKLSSIAQAAAVPGSSPLNALKTVPGDLYGAITDGLRAIGIGSKRTGNLGGYLQTLDEAMSSAKGSLAALDDILAKGGRVGKDLAEALNRGVLDGFVTSENLLSAWARTESAAGGWAKNWLTMGGEMTQGLESRMRLGLFLDLKNKLGDAAKAAKIVRDTQLDYGLLRGNPALYGNMRHVIPFLAFTAQSIPQQSKWLMRNPGVAVALAQFYGGNSTDEPILPWIGEQASIPIGKDREGNTQFLTTLGLPHEVLTDIPNPSDNPRTMGRQFMQNVVGSAHPLIKMAVGLTTGRDPFFGGKYGSYDKTPYALQALGMAERGEGSRIYRSLGDLGLLQPVVSAEQQVSRLFDPRTSGFEKLLTTLTGARVASNDPDRAKMQLLDDKLSRLPHVRTMEIPYLSQDTTDPLAAALLEERREAKKQLRAK